MNPIKLLILTANPSQLGSTPLRVEAEVRLIEEALQRSHHRDRFKIATKLAIRTTDLRRALLDHRPQIVHFCGHGTGEKGLVLETDTGQMQLVPNEAISQLFAAFEAGEIECVLLNACYSDVQATAIHQHVDCVIGMNQPIGDRAAIDFAEGFYDALGASSPYDEAFRVGVNAIALSGSREDTIPVLKYRKRPIAVAPTHDPDDPESPVTLTATPSPQSQTFGNISISGSNNPFSLVQSSGSVAIDQSQTHTTTVTHPDMQAIVAKLKQAIATSATLDEIDRETAAIPVKKLETELQKPQPNPAAINKTVTMLKTLLAAASDIFPLLAKLSSLI